MLTAWAVGGQIDKITSSDEARGANQCQWHTMRWSYWTRQTHEDTVNGRQRGPRAQSMKSAMQTQQVRAEQPQAKTVLEGQSRSRPTPLCKKTNSQMEADGRGVSQQEWRSATEVINQPLGIVCRQSGSRVRLRACFNQRAWSRPKGRLDGDTGRNEIYQDRE